jgi:hypothetical protein
MWILKVWARQAAGWNEKYTKVQVGFRNGNSGQKIRNENLKSYAGHKWKDWTMWIDYFF